MPIYEYVCEDLKTNLNPSAPSKMPTPPFPAKTATASIPTVPCLNAFAKHLAALPHPQVAADAPAEIVPIVTKGRL